MSDDPKPGSPDDSRKKRAAEEGAAGGVSATKPAEGGDEAPEGTDGSPHG